MSDPDRSPIAVVTGASRGVGRGIAIALGSHGCTVYVTGRSQRSGQADLPGTIDETAEAVTVAGGKGIAIACDHADDAQTKAVFDQVEREEGRLDILVNNAAKLSNALTEPGGFWEKPLELVDLLDVGLRSAYVCSYHAASMMVRQKHGLIVFTGSQGGVCYMLGRRCCVFSRKERPLSSPTTTQRPGMLPSRKRAAEGSTGSTSSARTSRWKPTSRR